MIYVVRVYSKVDVIFFFFFKQKTAYEIGTGDWSSDVCLVCRQSSTPGILCDREKTININFGIP